ncbi:hypothetical protein HPP92_021063 [Vanilla planifolia]|nr:hypothetical protein HPP92_021063 [Vanilla planifolia]
MTESTPNHTQTVKGWAARNSTGKITPFVFKRRENGPEDVTIKILFCGICHTDLHNARNDWGVTTYPVVPGHEITGVVIKVGERVSEFKLGDRVGVGCLAASCLKCDSCLASEENYCDDMQLTYGGVYWDGSFTYGGYSTMIVSHRRFVVRIPDGLPLDAAAPLLCAGITMFSPMRQHGMLNRPGSRLGIVGLGGLGHVGVKLGKAFGLRVTVISTSASKEEEALRRLGADDFIVSTNNEQLEAARKSMDFILDTVSAQHPIGSLLKLLKVGGTLVLVGVAEKPLPLPSFPLLEARRKVVGSLIGGMRETQEMMDLCGKHNITCDVEVVKAEQINEAMERLAKNDVRYRFVIDIGASSADGVA